MASNILRGSVVSAFLVSAIFTNCVSGDDWKYFGIYGEQNWSTIYPDCSAANHTRQSPVDIIVATTQVNGDLTEIDLVVGQMSNTPVTMVNNGHTVNLDFNQTAIYISGGNLVGHFRIGGVHFHWGSMDTEGSEHTINEKQFPIEMHVVTYDENRYTGVLQASVGNNSIAVLSVLFKLSTANNPALDPVVTHLKNVTIAGRPIYIPYFDMQALLPQNKSRYYRYLGSLTTPPCSESVIWSVFDDNVNISESQLAEFRKLQEEVESDGKIDYLIDNWREEQPLDGRIIQRSFTGGSSSDIIDSGHASGTDSSFKILSQIALLCVTMSFVLQLVV